ncbi:cell wall-binding repeat-containing protein [Euzebya tangerina]|uniref:cell wall-binding repeat-containing protein n=1 Tax=Euzebya tangerina TaxID=591198 RepID=UPI000E313440|nr:cell wall-binding repeat-containing protein [Euzebya tangerina]
MSRHNFRCRSLLVLPVVAALVAGSVWSASDAVQAQDAPAVITSRLAGETRLETAVAISSRAFPTGAPVVYLARSDNPVDAVVGGTLSDGPILLVAGCDDLADTVADEINRLRPDEIIALGGEDSVCEQVLLEAEVAAIRDIVGACTTGVTLDYAEDLVVANEVGVELDPAATLADLQRQVRAYLDRFADELIARAEDGGDDVEEARRAADAIRRVEFLREERTSQIWSDGDRSEVRLDEIGGRLVVTDYQFPSTCE